MYKYVFIPILAIGILVTFSCGGDDISRDDIVGPPIADDIKWWVLVHPNSDPGEPGIFLYNETTDSVEHSLPLPEGLESPHALSYDGESLWVGGFGLDGCVYHLDPIDGTVISRIENVQTEGLAISHESIWYSTTWRTPGALILVRKDGIVLDTVQLSRSTINDVATDDSCLYYVVNDDTDKIIKVDLVTGNETILVHTGVVSLYTLAIRDNAFVVINGNNIRRFDIATGEFLSDVEISVAGWITAMSPCIQSE